MDIFVQIVKNLQTAMNRCIENVSQTVDGINLPKEEETHIAPIESSTSPIKPERISLIAGIVLFILGLIIGKAFGTFCLLLGLAGVAYFIYKFYLGSKSIQVQAPVHTRIDYTSIFNILKETHQRTSDNWDKIVSDQVSLMKREIESLPLDMDNKILVYDMLAKNSIISFPMMDVLQNLMGCKNIQDFKNYLYSFKNDYTKALNEALDEESRKYQEIKKIIEKK